SMAMQKNLRLSSARHPLTLLCSMDGPAPGKPTKDGWSPRCFDGGRSTATTTSKSIKADSLARWTSIVFVPMLNWLWPTVPKCFYRRYVLVPLSSGPAYHLQPLSMLNHLPRSDSLRARDFDEDIEGPDVNSRHPLHKEVEAYHVEYK